jgi:hypothetical protein
MVDPGVVGSGSATLALTQLKLCFLRQVNSSAVQVLIENVQNLDRAYEFAER